MRVPVVSSRFIARLSSLPASAIDALSSVDIREATRTFLAGRSLAARVGTQASDVVFELIAVEPDAKRRGALLRFRRDLFNCRTPRAADHRALGANLAPHIADVIERAVEALHECARAQERLMTLLDASTDELRRDLARWASNPNLADGIMLSSPHLYQNLERYTNAGRLRSYHSRDLQIERGLLRYFTRASMKATPFASFCIVTEGYIVANEASTASRQRDRLDSMAVTSGSLSPRRNVVRLNKRIYGTLWNHLKTRASVRDRLTVDLNPTLRNDGEHWTFIAMVEAVEVFQRVASNPALDLLTAELRQNSGKRLKEVTQLLAADARVDATPDEVGAYLDALLRLGLLRFRSPVSPQDSDWQCSLLVGLESFDDEHARAVCELLRHANSVVSSYSKATTHERAASARALRASVNGVFQQLGLRELPDSFLILYEDCGAPLSVELGIDPADAEAFDALGDLADRLQGSASTRAEMARMRRYFDSRYEAEAGDVPLLPFFESYYREHLSAHLKSEAARHSAGGPVAGDAYDLFNPFGLEAVAQITRAQSKWTEVIRAAWENSRDAEEVTIDPAKCPSLAELPALDPSAPRSLAFFCQFLGAQEASRPSRIVVMNGQTFLGLGKYFSRFLFLTGQVFARAVMEENSRLGSERFAEIGGDANFNANLHPPLLADTIAYPTGDSDPSQPGIACDEIVVGRDPVDPISLVLRHRESSTRIYAVDLGFLTPRRRPALFRLLMAFAPGRSAAVPLPKRAFQNLGASRP